MENLTERSLELFVLLFNFSVSLKLYLKKTPYFKRILLIVILLICYTVNSICFNQIFYLTWCFKYTKQVHSQQVKTVNKHQSERPSFLSPLLIPNLSHLIRNYLYLFLVYPSIVWGFFENKKIHVNFQKFHITMYLIDSIEIPMEVLLLFCFLKRDICVLMGKILYRGKMTPGERGDGTE